MEGRECPLADAVVEDALKQLETLVGVAQPVTVGQEEYLAVNLRRLRLLMQDDTALLLQVFVGPDVVVARKVVYFDTQVGQL